MASILFFYHHFGGLGHGTRIFSLCRALKRLDPRYKLLVINSGRPQPELGIEKYAKVIHLPSFVNPLAGIPRLPRPSAKAGEARPWDSGDRCAGNTARLIFAKRAIALDKIIACFKPQISIFEHYPFGRKHLSNELNRMIDKLSEKRCLIYSSVRDIIVQKFDSDELSRQLAFFKAIFVHADRKRGFSTTFAQNEDVKDRVILTGRVIPWEKKSLYRKPALLKTFGYRKERAFIVASIGGGMDGQELLEKLICAKATVDEECPSLFLISAGTATHHAVSTRLSRLAKNKKDIVIKKFFSNFIDLVRSADLYISMGGYNSINNALWTKTKTMLFPRLTDEEQKQRSSLFQRELQAEILNYKTISVRQLSKKIIAALHADRPSARGLLDVDFGGAAYTARWIHAALTLRYLKIRLTTKCNCRCGMCSWKSQNAELDVKRVRLAIHQASLMNMRIVNLTGGEPTLYKHITTLVTFIAKKKMSVSLSTNGLFDRPMAEYLAKNVDHFDISLDSGNETLHNAIRGRGDAFQKTIATIRRLSNHKKKIHINTTVRPDNYRTIDRLVPFLAPFIQSISFTLVDISQDNSGTLKFCRHEVEKFYCDVVPRIYKNAVQNNILIKIKPFFRDAETEEGHLPIVHYRRFLLGYKERLKDIKGIFRTGPCVEPKDALRINTNGDVSPCCYLDDNAKLGNICQQDLWQILTSDLYFDFAKKSEPGRGICQQCQKSYKSYLHEFD